MTTPLSATGSARETVQMWGPSDDRLAFVRELDALKGVLRRTRVLGGERFENTAEHSWHLAMMALTLAPEADADVDVARVVKLLLCHDIVEIDADDTFVYDLAGRETKTAREQEAADRIFSLLPVDRFQPLLLNMGNGGGSWLSDATALFDAYAADPDVMTWLEFGQHADVASVADSYLARVLPGLGRGSEYTWAIEVEGQLIGTIAARPGQHGVDIGYVLGRAWWGRGLATEAVRLVTTAAFAATDHDRVWACVATPNLASARVLEKAGFTEEGTIRAWRRSIPGEPAADVRFFTRLRTD